MYGHYGQGNVTMRTSPATMRLKPNTTYTMTFETLGGGKVYVQSEADSSDKVLEESFQAGHSEFEFTTGDKTDYVVRIENGSVLDDFIVYSIEDETPPTAPAGLTATAVENSSAVKLSWTAAQDEDTGVASYNIYRDGSLLAAVPGTVTVYTDTATEDETEYAYQVSAVNAGGTEGGKSNEATVITGFLLPAAVGAEFTGTTSATVTFNRAMDKATAETAANYALAGTDVTVATASLADSGRTVTLTFSSALAATDTVTLTVANVKDASGNHAVSGEDTFALSFLYHYFKFDEAEEAAAIDSAGHANGVKRSAQSVEGKSGSAIYVNGGYVDVDSRVLTENNEFTISTWVKWDGGSTSDNCILSNDISGDASSRGITYKIRDGKFQVTSNIGGVQSDAAVPANEWVHLVMVKDAENVTLYLNGETVLTAENPFDMSSQNKAIRIGANSDGSGGVAGAYKGAIDEVMIYTAPLTAEEVAALYNGDAAPQTHTVTVEGGSGSGQYRAAVRGLEQRRRRDLCQRQRGYHHLYHARQRRDRYRRV